MADDEIPTSEMEDAVDPQSGIAAILRMMQGAADRSRPIDTIQHANRPMPTNARPDPQDIIRMLLEERQTAGGPLDLTPLYRR